MTGFTLEDGAHQKLLDLNFPNNSALIEEDNFVPKGDFWVMPPKEPIKCNGATIQFLPTNFSGPPAEHMV